MVKNKVFIALGSNLKNPIKQLENAIYKIKKNKSIELLASSPFYRSTPHGNISQDDFINAVVVVETTLSPEDLLIDLHKIEKEQDRIRKERWGPRTIDLDIILYSDIYINHDKLKVPHPEILNREFVLKPLLDLEKELKHKIILPEGFLKNNTLEGALIKLPKENLERLSTHKNSKDYTKKV